ncbi:hypothetical protein BDN72DRAFT_399958 [Pluteus cervinus]|uniref:Uncharacterized protein n=1 Tax=Pluteus cervinus TaxID=181527 RepID=A0ACD3B1J8_9AGAR|nr:hypothetical protein BDN72DRAFT_399958 [Pluteus cervinus]
MPCPKKSILKRTKPTSTCPSPSSTSSTYLSSSPSSPSSLSSRSSYTTSHSHSRSTSLSSVGGSPSPSPSPPNSHYWGCCTACGLVGGHGYMKPLPTTLTNRLSIEIIDAVLSHLASSRVHSPNSSSSSSLYPNSFGIHSTSSSHLPQQQHLHYFPPGSPYTSLSTLRTCTLVCKAWFPIARTYLFQTRKLLLSKSNVNSFLRVWKGENEESLGVWIRYLAIQQEDPSALFKPVLELERTQRSGNLTSESDSAPTQPLDLGINLPHTLIPRFSLYPSLTSLCLSWIQSPLTPLTISCLAEGFPALKSLEFRACSFSSLREFALIVSGHEGLERMALSDVEWFEEEVPEGGDFGGRRGDSQGIHPPGGFPSRLSTLELFITHSTYFIEWLLSYNLPVLEDVKLGSAFWDEEDGTSVGVLLKEVGGSLRDLMVCSPRGLKEVDLSFNPNLRSISISHLQIEPPASPVRVEDWFSAASNSQSAYADEEVLSRSQHGQGGKSLRRQSKSKSTSEGPSHTRSHSETSEWDSDFEIYDSPLSSPHSSSSTLSDPSSTSICPITHLLTQLRTHPHLEIISFHLLFRIPTSEALPLIDWGTISYLLAESNEGVGPKGWEQQLIQQEEERQRHEREQLQHEKYRQRADGLPPPSPLRVRGILATSTSSTSPTTMTAATLTSTSTTTTTVDGLSVQLQSTQPLNIRPRSPPGLRDRTSISDVIMSSPSPSPPPPPPGLSTSNYDHNHIVNPNSHPHLQIQTQNLQVSTTSLTSSAGAMSTSSILLGPGSGLGLGVRLVTPIILTTPATPPTPMTPPGTATQATYGEQHGSGSGLGQGQSQRGDQSQAQARPTTTGTPRSFPSLQRFEIRVPKISGGPPSSSESVHGGRNSKGHRGGERERQGVWWGSRRVRMYVEDRLRMGGWSGVDSGVLVVD